MAQESPPADIGLAEFLVKLVTDASEAFLVAQQQQHSYYSELDAAIVMAPSEFANAIPEGEVDRALANLFPSADPAQPHAIFVGATYHPGLGGPEDPPIQKLLGVQLVQPTGSVQQGSVGAEGARAAAPTGPAAPPTLPPLQPLPLRLTEQQVQLVRNAARLRTAVQQQASLAKVLSQPRVHLVVDSALIKAKVALGARGDQTTATTKPAAGITPSVQNLVKSPSPLRLSVRMVDDKAPQTSGLSVDVLSEIELRLKSIVQ